MNANFVIRRRRYERILELRVEPGEPIEIGRDLRRDSPEGVSAPGRGPVSRADRSA